METDLADMLFMNCKFTSWWQIALFWIGMLVTYYKPGTLPMGRKLYTGKLGGSPERGKKREDGKGC